MEKIGVALPPDHDFRAAIGPPMQSVVSALVGDDAELQTHVIALYR